MEGYKSLNFELIVELQEKRILIGEYNKKIVQLQNEILQERQMRVEERQKYMKCIVNTFQGFVNDLPELNLRKLFGESEIRNSNGDNQNSTYCRRHSTREITNEFRRNSIRSTQIHSPTRTRRSVESSEESEHDPTNGNADILNQNQEDHQINGSFGVISEEEGEDEDDDEANLEISNSEVDSVLSGNYSNIAYEENNENDKDKDEDEEEDERTCTDGDENDKTYIHKRVTKNADDSNNVNDTRQILSNVTNRRQSRLHVYNLRKGSSAEDIVKTQKNQDKTPIMPAIEISCEDESSIQTLSRTTSSLKEQEQTFKENCYQTDERVSLIPSFTNPTCSTPCSKPSTGTSNNPDNTTQLSTETIKLGEETCLSSTVNQRPKRSCTPTNMKEPKLHTKMRNNVGPSVVGARSSVKHRKKK